MSQTGKPHVDLRHRRITSVNRLLIQVISGCLLIFLCAVTIADPDLWGHTLYGMRAIEQGTLVEPFDPFSFTAVSASWVNHEWLSEYYMGWLYLNLGSVGLWLWRTFWAAVVVGVLGTRWLSGGRQTNAAALITLLFVAIALQGFFVYVRPQLATLGLFAVTLEILRRAWRYPTSLEHARYIWLLVPIICLWANFHGGFVAGLAILWLYAFAANIRGWFRPVFRRGGVRLLVITVVASWVTVVNPYGVRLHVMLWHHLAPHQDVIEWQPLFSFFQLQLTLPLVLLGFGLVGFGAERWQGVCRHGAWMELIVCGACAVQAIAHQRHVALLAIAVAILLAEPISAFVTARLQRILRQFQARPRVAAAVVALILVSFLGIRLSKLVPLARSGAPLAAIAVDARSKVPGVPVRAVHFLREAGISGNLVTDYGWGQYVIWHLFPQCRVAFDGRYRTIYPTDIERDFMQFVGASGSNNKQLRLLDRYPTDIALLPAHWPVVLRLENDANWQRVYRDHQAVVFLHRSKCTDELLSACQQAAAQSAQVPPWTSFPGQVRQISLAQPRSERKHVSNVKRQSPNAPDVRATASLAREVQPVLQHEFCVVWNSYSDRSSVRIRRAMN